MNKDDIDYETILKLINDIFVKADDDISKSIFENYKIKTIKTKLSFKDAFIYSLEYTKNNKTKIDIIGMEYLCMLNFFLIYFLNMCF
jgi:hypothetical protein